MTTEIELLPLDGPLRALPEHVQEAVRAYGHANVARATDALQAEIACLRREMGAMRRVLGRILDDELREEALAALGRKEDG